MCLSFFLSILQFFICFSFFYIDFRLFLLIQSFVFRFFLFYNKTGVFLNKHFNTYLVYRFSIVTSQKMWMYYYFIVRPKKILLHNKLIVFFCICVFFKRVEYGKFNVRWQKSMTFGILLFANQVWTCSTLTYDLFFWSTLTLTADIFFRVLLLYKRLNFIQQKSFCYKF